MSLLRTKELSFCSIDWTSGYGLVEVSEEESVMAEGEGDECWGGKSEDRRCWSVSSFEREMDDLADS